MSNLPVATEDAPLPTSYERARAALAECKRVDECKDWADKAQALASYARQAQDDSLYKDACRIQGRALRRAGELLKTFQTSPEGGRPTGNGVGDHPVSQRQAAESAGMSEHQEKQARRVANVPEADFESAVESDDPPTMTQLADMGKGSPPGPPPSAREGFYEATHTMGAVRHLAEWCEKAPPELVAHGLLDHELDKARRVARQVDSWLRRFIANLRKST